MQALSTDELNYILDDLRKNGHDLGTLGSIDTLKQGARSGTYGFYAHTPGQEQKHYVVSISDGINGHGNAFEAVAAFQHYLHEHHIPVAKPIGTAGSCMDGRRYMVTEFIEGRQFTKTELTPLQLENLGRMVGVFHKQTLVIHPADFNPQPPTGDLSRPFVTRHLKTGLCAARFMRNIKHEPWPWREGAMIVGRHAAEKAKGKISIKTDLPEGFLHGDLHAYNFIFQGDNYETPRLIDLGDLRHGPLISDLAYAIKMLCWKKTGHEEEVIDKDKIKAFLHGYEQERRLTKEEKEELPRRILNSAFGGGIVWAAAHHEERHLGKHYPDGALNRLRQWVEICEPRNRKDWLGKS